jgi:hypothetical protein
MLELGTFGSVRGVPGNGYPYRNPRLGTVAQLFNLPAPEQSLKCRPGGRQSGDEID